MEIDTEELPDAVAMSLFSARDWHSGQRSALYAWASTGTPVLGLAAEARDCARLAEAATASADSEELEELITDAEALAALAVWAERRGL